MNLYGEQNRVRGGGRADNGHTSRYLRLAVETSSLVSLGEQEAELAVAAPQQLHLHPLADPFLATSRNPSPGVSATTRPILTCWRSEPGEKTRGRERTNEHEPGRGRSCRPARGAATPCRRGPATGGRRRPPPPRPRGGAVVMNGKVGEKAGTGPCRPTSDR
jgi:hypothetical protein